jgi:hypothetical protein
MNTPTPTPTIIHITDDANANSESETSPNAIEDKELHECFICLEHYINGERAEIMKSHSFYSKTCVCNGYVHAYCLKKWYIVASYCPICRESPPTPITRRILIRHVHILHLPYSPYLVYYMKHGIRLMFLFILFYSMLECMIHISKPSDDYVHNG